MPAPSSCTRLASREIGSRIAPPSLGQASGQLHVGHSMVQNKAERARQIRLMSCAELTGEGLGRNTVEYSTAKAGGEKEITRQP